MGRLPKIRKTKKDFFKKKNLIKELTRTHISPSDKYSLIIETYTTGPGTWNYTKGIVIESGSGKIISKVYRNYGHFWYRWIEGHSDGHDYLLCGEDYQGQTIIRLDTGERKDFKSDGADKGVGFCWTSADPSPDKTKLAVHGCYWGAPYEVLLFDFRDPFKQPELLGWLEEGNFIIDDVISWNDNDTITIKYPEEFRQSDGKALRELSSEDRDKSYDNSDYDERDKLIDLTPTYKK